MVTGSSTRSIMLLVVGEKEARGIAESIGRHQLRLALVGVAIVNWSPTLRSLVVLSWRSARGNMGGHPGAGHGTRSRLWSRSRGQRGDGGGSIRDGDGSWCLCSSCRGRRCCFLGRAEFLV